jgi:hypothetical protein
LGQREGKDERGGEGREEGGWWRGEAEGGSTFDSGGLTNQDLAMREEGGQLIF